MADSAGSFDAMVRSAVWAFLDGAIQQFGGELPWSLLQQGITLEGRRIPLVSMQGIFKPRELDLPLSLRTAAPRLDVPAPYDDAWDERGLRYAFRKDDRRGRVENALVMQAMDQQVPLVYFLGLAEGRYHAFYPVWVVDADPAERTFLVADEPLGAAVLGSDDARRYRVRQVRSRLHQARFRTRLLTAYRSRCAMCRLQRRELLDASHITADVEETGVPDVTNGLALCKIHHAAFDSNLLGVRPDYVIEARPDILETIDGPMLRHGLQEMHGRPLAVLPRRVQEQPSRERLEARYERFREAG